MLLSLAGVLGLAFAVSSFAGPVGNNSGFEDDDGNLVVNSTFDWNGFSRVSWQPSPTSTPTREADKVTSGWTFKGIEDWQNTTADSAFAGGTKQDDDCATVTSAKAPNKDDLKRIYLATKTVPVSGVNHVFLNLAWARIPQNTTSASAHVGFEFNQSDDPCGGSSDGLVERTAGDMLIVYDFAGGTATPQISLRRWITSGTCEVGSSAPPCWGPKVNLTSLGFAEGKVNVGEAVLDQLAPPALSSTTGTSVNQNLNDSEFGEAGIDLTAAGVFNPNQCTSFGNAFGVSRSSGNSENAQMKDLVGPADFELNNCGDITIIKRTDPRGENQNFGFTSNIAGAQLSCTADTTPASFTLNDDAGVDNSANTEFCENVPAGSYTVTEGADPSGFAFESLTCTASGTGTSVTTAGKTATITMAGLGSVTCIYVNRLQQGAIKIEKRSTKSGNPLVSNAGAVFSYDGHTVTDNGTGDEDPTIGEVCVSGLTPGNYTVNETSPPPGYGDAGQTDQVAVARDGTNCTDNQPAAADVATFTNPPLSDIQVRFRDAGSGETHLGAGGISCDNTTGTTSNADTANWDDTKTVSDAEAPTTITCTIDIYP
jgi:Prealbumin-like fold domain